MAEKKGEVRSDRRDFLRLAGLGATVGVAAVAGGAGTRDAEAAEPGTDAGYRETAHIKQYYKLASF